ncbi:MAG: slipin family protein, partial [Pseudolabrys sp.]
KHPESMQLRYLSTLQDIAGEKNSTIVFPVPIDLLHALHTIKPVKSEA